MDNRENFCNEANEFLYERGYNPNQLYFMFPSDADTTYEGDKTIYFYLYKFTIYKHPNGKIISDENLGKHIHWICELLRPIIEKYNILEENIR